MKFKVSAVITVLVLSAVALPTIAADSGWLVDFEKAKSIATKEKKDILMDFTGSDWCPYCVKLDEGVFSTEQFKKDAPSHFVLVKVDFPKDKSKQSKEEIAQNEKLQAQFKVSGYPTVILADAKGRPYAQMVGYGGEPVADYMTKLENNKKTRVQRDEFLTKAAAAKGVEKAKYLDQAVSLLDAELALSAYQDEIDQIIALDKDNAAQLKDKYTNMKQLQDVKKKLDEIASAHADDPKATLEALNKLYAEMKPKGAVAVEILYVRSFMKYQTDDKAGARADLEAAIKADPTSSRAEEIRDVLKRAFEDVKDETPAQQ